MIGVIAFMLMIFILSVFGMEFREQKKDLTEIVIEYFKSYVDEHYYVLPKDNYEKMKVEIFNGESEGSEIYIKEQNE